MARKTFDLGTTLALPNELAGRRSAIFGISGSGKSNTATVCIEGLLRNGEQVVVIDPKGEGWGLLSLADGSPSGLDVIVFGEPNGHIDALDESHGPQLARFVVESGRSMVLSLLGFDSDRAERRFAAKFLRELYRLKSRQAQGTRVCVVIEEAHLFVPENPRGDQADLAGAVQRCVRQGRSQGIGVVLVDQRPQDVAKRVITQCETVICHQLVHKLDRDALRDWVRGYDRGGQGETFLDSLASLRPGEAWVWSPAWLSLFERVTVRRRETFDSGASPEGGAEAVAVRREEVDLEALRGQLADVVEKAESEDPRKLREQVEALRGERDQLQDQLDTAIKRLDAERARPPGVDQAAVDEAVRGALAERDAAWKRAVTGLLDDLEEHRNQLVERIASYGGDLESVLADMPPARNMIAFVQETPGGTLPAPGNGDPDPWPDKLVGYDRGDGEPGTLREGVSRPQRKILDALAWFEVMGIDSPSRSNVAAIAGVSPRSSGFEKNISTLRAQHQAIDYPSASALRLTDAGRSMASRPGAAPTLRALHQAWLSSRALSRPQAVLLEILLAAYPQDLARSVLAEASAVSVRSSGFEKNVSRLSSMGLVVYPEPGRVQANGSLLFPAGLK